MNGKSIVSRRYKDVCAVYEFVQTVNGRNHITSKAEKKKYDNVPCRLSFNSSAVTAKQNLANAVTQQIKLFLSPDLQIDSGSKIVVTHEGRQTAYRACSEPKIYPSHQELELEIAKEWA